ncbi:MAG: hypothetical protein HOO94_07860 [Novosphingobium sp.]|uniref:DUF6538 domain-containing protein n=1 Tax=Novosphingobium sp. TaxID=1874826 RepID=UPI00182D0AD9|nr:hypothetical protein [Novosphingobium sp.]
MRRREIWRSLDTDSYAVAVRRLHLTATAVEAVFERARQSLGQPIDPKLLMALDSPSGDGLASAHLPVDSAVPADAIALGASRTSERTISEAYGQFLADPKHAWSKRTTIAHETTRRWVMEVFCGQARSPRLHRKAAVSSLTCCAGCPLMPTSAFQI